MADANATLQSWIDGLQRLGREGLAEIAAAAEAPVLAEAQRTAAAGTTPDGQPWAPRKKDGERALEHAAEHITVKAAGPTLRIKLTGPDVFHHFGTRGVKRAVIPEDHIPAGIARALQTAAGKVFERRTVAR